MNNTKWLIIEYSVIFFYNSYFYRSEMHWLHYFFKINKTISCGIFSGFLISGELSCGFCDDALADKKVLKTWLNVSCGFFHSSCQCTLPADPRLPTMVLPGDQNPQETHLMQNLYQNPQVIPQENREFLVMCQQIQCSCYLNSKFIWQSEIPFVCPTGSLAEINLYLGVPHRVDKSVWRDT